MAPRKKTTEKPKEEVFVVDRIVDKKREGGLEFYRVRWYGYTEAEDTWEPASKLAGLPEVEAFEAAMKKQKRSAAAIKPCVEGKADAATLPQPGRANITRHRGIATRRQEKGPTTPSAKKTAGVAKKQAPAKPSRPAKRQAPAEKAAPRPGKHNKPASVKRSEDQAPDDPTQPIAAQGPLKSLLKRQLKPQPVDPLQAMKKPKSVKWEDTDSPNSTPHASLTDQENVTPIITPTSLFSSRVSNEARNWRKAHHTVATCATALVQNVEESGSSWTTKNAQALEDLLYRECQISCTAYTNVKKLREEEEMGQPQGQ